MQRAELSPPRAGDVLDGYRLLRKLGEGGRAEVFLGIADGEPPAALKVYRATCSNAEREIELEALTRAAHAHVIHVRDVASNSVILERLELGTLAQLLAGRAALSVGEALTVLAPLGSALDAMHASGVSHGSITQQRVLFRATGAPVIAAFGKAALHEPGLTPAALATNAGVLADRASFARLAHSVLALTVDDRAARVAEWLAVQGEHGYPDDIGEALGERLFEFADAEPVRFERDELPTVSTVPSRLGAGTVPSLAARRTGLPEWVDEVVSESLDGSPIAALRARILPHLRGVRRPVWVVAGAVAAALVVALLVVPTNDDGSESPVVADPAPSESPVVIEDDAMMGDEPVEALVALLEVRQRCIRDLSVLCLDAVNQAGSTAMADDVALVRSLQTDEGQEQTAVPDARLDPSTAELVERLGDSALIRLAADAHIEGVTATDDATKTDEAEMPTASLLLMKGEAGWRIRSYLMPD